MKTGRFFTLLEIMVALGLLLIAGGLVGWKLHAAVLNKQFRSDLAQLESRLAVCHRLAVAMQSDWKGTLIKRENRWVFESSCADTSMGKKLKPLSLHSFALSFDGIQSERFEIDFFSSGQILPQGVLSFCRDLQDPDSQKAEWVLPQIFQREGSDRKKLGPLHPED